MLALGAIEPGRHGLGCADPTEHALPSGQARQSLVRLERKPTLASTLWSACVPPGHGWGADEPSTQSEPDVQLRHVVAPLSVCDLPAGQSVHTSVPVRAAKLPGKHSRQTSGRLLPGIELAFPASQGTHELLLEAPMIGLYVPEGQAANVCRTLAAP